MYRDNINWDEIRIGQPGPDPGMPGSYINRVLVRLPAEQLVCFLYIVGFLYELSVI